MLRTFSACLLALISLQTMVMGQASRESERSLLSLRQKMLMLNRRGPGSVIDELQIANGQLVELAALREEIAIFSREQGKTLDRSVPPAKEGEIDFARAAAETLNSILDDQQRRRLAQLELQRDGAMALVLPGVPTTLELSAAQKVRIQDAQRDFVHVQGFRPAESYTYFGHACYAILNEKQRSKWQEMIGEPSEAVQSRAPLVPGRIPPQETTARQLTGISPSALLETPAAKAQLGLSAEQLTQLAESRLKFEQLFSQREAMTTGSVDRSQTTKYLRELMQSQAAYRKLCDEALSDVQKMRLHELQFQSLREQALLQREFREAARLSDDQINSLDRLLKSQQIEATLSPKEKLIARQEILERGLKYLSDSQRQVWDRMTGPLVPPESLLNVKTDPVD
jgi:hypothetical protein